MTSSDVDRIVTAINKAAEAVSKLFMLTYEVRQDLAATLEQLPKAPVPAGELDLSPYTARQIAAAALQLEDRRAALARTYLHAALEQRRGRRIAGAGGATYLPNGSNGHTEIGTA